LTFDEARFVKEKLTCGRAVPNTKKRNFEGVPASACWGIDIVRNCLVLAVTRKPYLQSTDYHKRNLLFGSSGIVSRTLDHWREVLDDAFKLIESLRAELFKLCAETQKALGEKDRAESECFHAKLKMEKMRATAAQNAFQQADQQYSMRKAKGQITSCLLWVCQARTRWTG
jgi:hypothetical protein